MAISKYKMEHGEIIRGFQEKDTYRYLGTKPA